MLLEKSTWLKEREHEAHIPKSDNGYFTKEAFRVVSVKKEVENGRDAELTMGEKKVPLLEGTVLGVNELILSNDCLVEVRSEKGLFFRLDLNSEFALELTINGIAPVFYGTVYKGRIQNEFTPMCGGKIRTSCWIACPTVMLTKSIDAETDAYYAFSESCEVWEYDERGRRFTIVTINEGEKVVMKHNPDKPMRQRYSIESVNEITDEEYDVITMRYMNPKNWR